MRMVSSRFWKVAVSAPATDKLRRMFAPFTRLKVGPPVQDWPLLRVTVKSASAMSWFVAAVSLYIVQQLSVGIGFELAVSVHREGQGPVVVRELDAQGTRGVQVADRVSPGEQVPSDVRGPGGGVDQVGCPAEGGDLSEHHVDGGLERDLQVAGARHEKQRRGDGLGDVACRLAGRHVQGQLVHDAFERVGGRHSRQSSVVGRSDAAVHGCCGGVVRELEVHRSGRQPDEKPAYSSEQDFWDGAAVLRSSLWDKVEGQVEPVYSQALWDLTLEEANKLGKGWLEGPLSKDQLDAMFPEGWSPCRRFAVWQGKWRPIDDFSECGINACFGCFERISLKALDEITWACVQIFRCAVTRGDVSFTLQDGSSLQGRLHSAWHDAD
eukprot:s12728_g1.t1